MNNNDNNALEAMQKAMNLASQVRLGIGDVDELLHQFDVEYGESGDQWLDANDKRYYALQELLALGVAETADLTDTSQAVEKIEALGFVWRTDPEFEFDIFSWYPDNYNSIPVGNEYGHTDAYGEVLSVGDNIVTSYRGGAIYKAVIIGFSAHRVRVREAVKGGGEYVPTNKHLHTVVKVN